MPEPTIPLGNYDTNMMPLTTADKVYDRKHSHKVAKSTGKTSLVKRCARGIMRETYIQ